MDLQKLYISIAIDKNGNVTSKKVNTNILGLDHYGYKPDQFKAYSIS